MQTVQVGKLIFVFNYVNLNETIDKMPPIDDAVSLPESKNCKYCKGNVDKAGVKCAICQVCYHQSCALRITGLQVTSGSKNLVHCGSCAKNIREQEVTKIVKEALLEKENLIQSLESKLSMLQGVNIQEPFENLSKKMDLIEKNILQRVINLEKVQQKNNVNIPINHTETSTGPINGSSKAPKINSTTKNGRYALPEQPRATPKGSKERVNETEDITGSRHANEQPKSNGSEASRTSTRIRNPSETPEISIDVDVFDSDINNLSKAKTGNEDKWITVVNRRQRENTLKIKRPEPLKGSNEDTSCSLKTAPRMAFLFLSGLAPETTGDDVLQFLKINELENGCKCEKLKTKREKYRSSFKLTVPIDQRPKLLSASLWPSGTIINHFLNIQSQGKVKTNSQKDNNRNQKY